MEYIQWMQDKFREWYENRKWIPFNFQSEALHYFSEGYCGLINAPTGSGKTYSIGLPLILDGLYKSSVQNIYKKGVKAIWISPIRALAPEIEQALKAAVLETGSNWNIQNRTGDTSASVKAKQKSSPPDFLITTPESLHILLSQKGAADFFSQLETVVVDEWHELIGTKRGVQMELALSRLRGINPGLKTWGISATIGNLNQAVEVLLGYPLPLYKLIKADINKETEVITILPDEIETMPWAGHMGLHLIDKLIPVIEEANTCLVFTNTRNQAEVWYQAMLSAKPEWAGMMALHHGSLGTETRNWVEEALHSGTIKVVVCTSSLDLGVDFRPVDRVVQIGSPKGVSRFAQRAGRSGHRPGEISRIFWLPTNSLELLEASAFRQALNNKIFEPREPFIRAFDVLSQYLATLAAGDGFREEIIYKEITATYCYRSVNADEWKQVLQFITTGGASLAAYEEFKRVQVINGLYIIEDKRTAMRQRLSIGTIVGDTSIAITYSTGRKIGNVEEYFISKLTPGDVFIFAGRTLELVSFRGMQAIVKNSNSKKAIIPSWQGGRMPLSTEVSAMLRSKLQDFMDGDITDVEMQLLVPLLKIQHERSTVPREDQLLSELYYTNEGTHLFFFPFEGRLVHEGMAMLFAYRLSIRKAMTFSIAMNDYGFELLTDYHLKSSDIQTKLLFDVKNLSDDLFACSNYAEIARRRFRDIASIAGLLFKGFPGRQQKTRHLQANAGLFYDVFSDYDRNNLLLKQALEEALYFQLEENRMRDALKRMQQQEFILNIPERPSPFAFPVMVDRLREKVSNETIEQRVQRMISDMQSA